MRRRELNKLFAGAIAAWPWAAYAQQSQRFRTVGILLGAAEDDPDAQLLLGAFRQGLQQSGWVEGQNVRLEIRWAAGDPEAYRKYAAEMVAIAPDVVLASASSIGPMLQATRTIPIVFAFVGDPVGLGIANSLARPGGNATGFMQFEFGMIAKWPVLLKELVPNLT